MTELIPLLEGWCGSLPAPLGWSTWLSGKALAPRKMGVASHLVFPLPALPLRTCPRGHGRQRERRGEFATRLVNLWVLVLNWLYADVVGAAW